MSEPDSNPEKRIALFQRKEVRRVIHNNEWWFEARRKNMVTRPPSPLPSPPGRGNRQCAAPVFRKLLCLSPLVGGANRGAEEWHDRLITRRAGERFSLSSGERAGVRASVGLTFFGNARRELEKKSGRKVVTNENYLGLTQVAKKVKQMKGES